MKIPGTNIEVTPILHQSQSNLWDCDAFQNLLIMKAQNGTHTGHVVYYLEGQHRDIIDEKMATDNIELFTGETPDGTDFQSLFEMIDENTPTERTPELDKIQHNCDELPISDWCC